MNKLQEIIDESCLDGKGVIVHIDNMKWIIETFKRYEKALEEISTYERDFYGHDMAIIAKEALK
ncbi:hypothetical protein ACI3ER_12045 [Bacillus sp. Wb]